MTDHYTLLHHNYIGLRLPAPNKAQYTIYVLQAESDICLKSKKLISSDPQKARNILRVCSGLMVNVLIMPIFV